MTDACEHVEAEGDVYVYEGVKDVNGVPHGFGTMKNNTGIYVGNFEGGKKCGHGTWEGFVEKNRFTGLWEDDVAVTGTMYEADGSVFTGSYKNGLKHGEGEWIDCTSTAKYVGLWNEGMMNGPGQIVYSQTGVVEKGFFRDDQWEGVVETIYPHGTDGANETDGMDVDFGNDIEQTTENMKHVKGGCLFSSL